MNTGMYHNITLRQGIVTCINNTFNGLDFFTIVKKK